MLFCGKVWFLWLDLFVAFEVCMCRNPVGFLGFSGFQWVLFAFSDLSMLAFLCVCAYGYEGTKV